MFYSAFILGLAGSFHCFGMCGPLTLLIPGNKAYVLGRLFYNLGRIATYILLGIIGGFLGREISFAVPQKLIFLGTGFMLLIYVLLPPNIKHKISLVPVINRLNNRIKQGLGLLHSKKGMPSQWLFGMLNGLMPCGMVYAALSAAFLTSSVKASALFMVFFGLGTLPMMMSFGWIGKILSQRLRIKPNWIYAVSYTVLAVVMLYKGWNVPLNHYANSHEMTICRGK